jgi:hypothetical protein
MASIIETWTQSLTPEQGRVFTELCNIIVETVKETGSVGAPSGIMYAAVMNVGMRLEQYELIMAALVKDGRLRKRGHVYYAT